MKMDLPDVPQSHIAIFVSFSGRGGVEKMICNLSRGLLDQGHRVDLVLVRSESEHLAGFPEGVNLVRLQARHTLTSLFSLARYLRTSRPDALLAAKDRAGQIAVLARLLSGGIPSRLLIRIGTTPSAALAGRSPLKKFVHYLPMRLLYRLADGIIAVSRGVAADLETISRLPGRFFHTIYNPTIPPDIADLSRKPCDHPWLSDGGPPVLVAVGRLTRQKDFPTLIRAFARLQETTACRLLILGEGQGRTMLEALRDQLGLRERIDMPGFVANPYAFLARADLFVLSSAWEGSPNVLVEAMAVGTPVVATDCPSGPREILRGGTVCPLVPVGDVDGLAAAMQKVLANPPAAETLQGAVRNFSIAESARQYAEVLLRNMKRTI